MKSEQDNTATHVLQAWIQLKATAFGEENV